ncbi:hypothetical protein NPIL_648991, partial [Nephila pilipes]
MSSLKERTEEKPWRNDILNLPDCPRSITVAAFRLTTGHDCLYAHLCRFRTVLHARSAAVGFPKAYSKQMVVFVNCHKIYGSDVKLEHHS